MLPKPKFNVNSDTSAVNTSHGWQQSAQQSSQSWFDYNRNQSLNGSVDYHRQQQYQQNHQRFQSQPQQMNFHHNYGHITDGSNSDNNNQKTFSCHTCVRQFPNQQLLDQHISQHIVCGLDDCTFKAHPKVIDNHQKMQHFCFKDKTQIKKFMSLDTEEDIKKWREERRKHFPTKDNIRLKDEVKEKEKLKDIERRNKLSEEMTAKQCDRRENDRKSKDKSNKRSANYNNNSKRSKSGQTYEPVVNNRKLTLFQKLLLNDIQRNESNIMDTIEKIVENNFFEESKL
ncbi:FMR1-interacting protein NUFIP1-like [Oppia nitens]|uniref:FMR1-interacting protein NUFIP1-like n=1 Tax=Oppia nitens TaxID=1686743 RepID=UPI0023DC8D5A|nr:FMR1-interacting protein NUFIP1-like [Oppia nitens]